MNDVRSAMKDGSVVTLFGSEGSAREFNVIKEVGRGGTCIVYDVTFLLDGIKRSARLKEFYPADTAAFSYGIKRGEDNALIVPDASRPQFEKKKEKFRSGCIKQIRFYELFEETRNSVVYSLDIYIGANTEYCLMLCDEGRSYDKITDTSLEDILITARSAAKVIGCYHKNGYLHLDIKPANIFILPETRELIKMFDFDSVIDDEHIANGSEGLSRSPGYDAPELIKCDRKKIGHSTDVFSIAAVVFEKIFGRVMTEGERVGRDRIVFPEDSVLFAGVHPRVRGELLVFFKKTMMKPAGKRCRDTDELINMLDSLIQSAKPLVHALDAPIPSLTAGFMGREDIFDAIDGYFAGGRRFVMLTGDGGIGKTEAAVKYAARMGGNAFFTTYSADIKVTVASLGFTDFVYEDTNGAPKPLDEIYSEKMKYLKQYKDGLLIIDNFDLYDSSGIDDVLSGKEFEELVQSGLRVIFTTRNNIDINRIEVKRMDSTTLVSMMRAFCPSLESADTAVLEQIASEVEGNTLIVELIAKTIKQSRGRISPEDMLAAVRSGDYDSGDVGSVRAASRKKGAIVTDERLYAHIKTLFDMSRLSDDDKTVLSNMSVVPLSGMGYDMFLGLNGVPRDAVRVSDGKASAENGGREVLDRLIDTGWIKLDEKTYSIRLHSLVQRIVQHEFPPADDMENDFLCGVEDVMAADKGAEKELDYAFERMITETGVLIADTVMKDKPLRKASWYDHIARQYAVMLEFDTAAEYLESAAEIRSHMLDDDNVLLGMTYSRLGELYAGLCRYKEAQESYDRAMRIFMIKYGRCHPYIITVYKQTAACFVSMGEYDSALGFYTEAEDILSLFRGADHPDHISLFVSIGNIYFEKGSYSDAMQYYRKALYIIEKNDLEKTSEAAAAYNCIGRLYNNTAGYKQALSYHMRSLEIYKDVFRERHPVFADIYDNIGIVYIGMSEYKKAVEMFIKALDTIESVYPENHPTTALVHSNLGAAYSAMCDNEKAREHYEAALRSGAEALPDKNPAKAISYLNMAGYYTENCDLDKAIEYFDTAFRLFDMSIGMRHFYTSMVYSGISRVYALKGDFDKAEEFGLEAVDVRREILGGEHPETGAAYKNLGDVYMNAGDYADAIDNYRTAENIYSCARETPALYEALLFIGMIYAVAVTERSGGADAYARRANDILDRTMPEGKLYYSIMYVNMGRVHLLRREGEIALKYLKKALSLRNGIMSEKHAETAMTYTDMASAYIQTDRFEEGKEYALKALEIIEDIVPENRRMMSEVYYNMAVICYHAYGPGRAEGYCKRALEIYGGTELPKQAMMHRIMGKAYAADENYKEALKELECAAKIYAAENECDGRRDKVVDEIEECAKKAMGAVRAAVYIIRLKNRLLKEKKR